MPGIDRMIRSISKSIGNRYKIYAPDGTYLGIEKEFSFPIKRSVDEHVAAFGRTAIFHNRTKLYEGCSLEDMNDGEKYIVNASRSFSFEDKLILWSLFLLQINCKVDFYRRTLVIADPDNPSKANYEMQKIISDIDGYIQKKDWTMATMTRMGRDERGYETLICTALDIEQGDRAKISNKIYIVQDVNTNIRENMLAVQLGIEAKKWE